MSQSTLTKLDCMLNKIEHEIAVSQSSLKKLTFFPVDEIDINELNNNHIYYYFQSMYKPLVIRGGCKHFEAISKWQIDFKYLISKCGDNDVYVRTETNKASYRNGQRYKIDRMKFSKYLNRIKTNDSKSKNSYLAVTNIRYRLNEIIGDIPLCNFQLSSKHKNDRVRIFKLFKNNDFKFKLHSGPHLWIAYKNHYEFNHFDIDDSILCMINGQKKVRIFSPNFLNGMHCNKYGTKGRTIQSQIDFHDNDDIDIFNKFSNFTKYNVYGYETILNDGDILFIPAFWFHQITSLTTSISINYFCGNFDDENNHYPSRIFKYNYNSLKYWFLNIIEQNRNYQQFLSVIGNLEKSIYNTFYKQWHDFCTKQQIDILIKEVIQYLMDQNVRNKNDIYYKFGDLTIKSNLPNIPKNNPFIKIRGLLYRDD